MSLERKREIALASVFQPGQVFSPAMAKNYRIELVEHELGQVLDGLEIRAESWRRTAEYPRTDDTPDGEFFTIEECSDDEEADGIASLYEAIIGKIRKQLEVQS